MRYIKKHKNHAKERLNMEYVLMCTKSQQIYYVYLTSTRAIKKVTDLSQASRFSSMIEAKNLREHASGKLKKYKIRSINDAIKQNSIAKEKYTKRKIIPTSIRTNIYNKAKGRCAICGKFIPCNEYTIDHIVPLSKGGTDEESNLQCCCLICNQMKQDMLPNKMMKQMSKIMMHQLEKKENKKYKKRLKKQLKKRS